jgi:hypothetical protein
MDIAHPRANTACVSDMLGAPWISLPDETQSHGDGIYHATLYTAAITMVKNSATRLALAVHMRLARRSKTLWSTPGNDWGGTALLPKYPTIPKRALVQFSKPHPACSARDSPSRRTLLQTNEYVSSTLTVDVYSNASGERSS